MAPTPPRAVMFDIGGVVVGSPLVAINAYERDMGLPNDYLNVAITKSGTSGAFQRFERSETDLYTFYTNFGQELSDAKRLNAWYEEFCKARGTSIPQLPKELKVDGRVLFGRMMKESTKVDPLMEQALRKLRQSGKFKLAALTNNFAPPTTSSSGSNSGSKVPSLEEELAHLGIAGGHARLREMFDHYMESAVIGMRKPEEGIYRHAIQTLGVKPAEIVFLDDIGINLKAAAALGIRTIRVSPISSLPALRKLEQEVGIALLDDASVKAEEDRLRALKASREQNKARL